MKRVNWNTQTQRRRPGFGVRPSRYRRRDRFPIFFGVVAVIIVLGIIAAVIVGAVRGVNSVSNQQSVTCTVTGKDRTTDSDGNSIYRVYTSGGEKCTTFEVTDSAWFGNFNSADLFGALHEGTTYRMEITGVRNGFFSMFPTIQKAVEVSP